MSELDLQQLKFIDNYLQTYSAEIAAIKAGYPKEEALKIGLDLLSNSIIDDAIKAREKELESSSEMLKMSKERLLRSMYYIYNEALKKGRTNEAIGILEKIATWSGVKPDEVQLEPVQLIINNLNDNKI